MNERKLIDLTQPHTIRACDERVIRHIMQEIHATQAEASKQSSR